MEVGNGRPSSPLLCGKLCCVRLWRRGKASLSLRLTVARSRAVFDYGGAGKKKSFLTWKKKKKKGSSHHQASSHTYLTTTTQVKKEGGKKNFKSINHFLFPHPPPYRGGEEGK